MIPPHIKAEMLDRAKVGASLEVEVFFRPLGIFSSFGFWSRIVIDKKCCFCEFASFLEDMTWPILFVLPFLTNYFS